MTRVEAVGPLDADIFILGESPGNEEVRRGEPFIGASGKELDKLLTAAGIARNECYITNTVKTLPRGKKDTLFFNNGQPTSFYMDGIIEIISELKTVKPNVVAAVGNYALWAVTQKTGIHKQRGSILESTLIPGQKVIPVIHPAWFLRTHEWHKLPLSEWDWRRISEQSRFPEINHPPYEFIVSPSPAELAEAEVRLLNADHITVDTEWYSPENIAYMQFTDSNDWAICVPMNNMLAYRFCKKILLSTIPKWMQNAMFDVPALARIGIKVRNMQHDTMIAWNVLFGDLKVKSLAVIGSVLTLWPYWKDEGEFVGKDEERGQHYGCIDAVVTDESMEKMLHSEFAIWGAKKAYDISMAGMDIFLRAATKGTLCDTELLKKKRAEKLKEADDREDALSQKIGYTINCRSPKQVAALVFDELKVKRKKRSTDQKILMDIAASTHDKELKEILTDIIHVRQDRNICSRFLHMGIVDVDGRIKTNWNLAGTRNGRYSTTIPWWNGVAVQTFPWEARDIFIPDPGHTFVGWDLEQAEARVVAVKTRDYELLDALASDIDIHIKLASELPFNLTYEEIVAICDDVGKDDCDERFLAKKCRHAMNYLLTWHGLKGSINREYVDTNVGVDAAMAKVLRAKYLELSPGLETWWKEVYFEVRDKTYLTNALGRRRNFFGRLREEQQLHRDAIAFYPQSTIADSTTLAIVEMDEKMSDDCIVMAHMHDGGFIQVPDDEVDESVEIVRAATNRTLIIDNQELLVPSEVKVGPNWRDMEKVI